MFAISFDLLISNLKQSYGGPYNNAYYEISTVWRHMIFTVYKEVYI